LLCLVKLVFRVSEQRFVAIHGDATSVFNLLSFQRVFAMGLWTARLFNVLDFLPWLGDCQCTRAMLPGTPFGQDAAMLLCVIALQTFVLRLFDERRGGDGIGFPGIPRDESQGMGDQPYHCGSAVICCGPNPCPHDCCATCLDSLCCRQETSLPSEPTRAPVRLRGKQRPALRNAAAQFPRQEIATSPCGHMFHKTCLDDWLAHPAGNNCPTCRYVLVHPEKLLRQRKRSILLFGAGLLQFLLACRDSTGLLPVSEHQWYLVGLLLLRYCYLSPEVDMFLSS
jgi:hypothetical protein